MDCNSNYQLSNLNMKDQLLIYNIYQDHNHFFYIHYNDYDLLPRHIQEYSHLNNYLNNYMNNYKNHHHNKMDYFYYNLLHYIHHFHFV
ncbi:hypothetical protein BCR32DRAFT_328813 [Anaeromyces robustus]|uniref:Uncharacterized protein n=1 Tax=Anaeromyces robustus TaxID=1754192 RepID=A0A1Y1WWD9_9FUNG|nr:hypothetical protein BCR32DRAFT_328813 [Anaeromyces robustus]|eukprot:ORX77715.1 hypothetical protein BCR32DRAFT_328813 [Anaeromyces robustus]